MSKFATNVFSSIRCLWVGLVCLAWAAAPAQAVNNGIPIPLNDRRFDAVGMFFVGWQPVPTCAGAISGSCTLVGPNLAMFARHSLGIAPTDPLPDPVRGGYRVRFRRAADGRAFNWLTDQGVSCHGVYQESLVDRFIEPPQQYGDQVLAVLRTPPVGIRPISLELDNPPGAANTPIMLAGWGYTGPCLQAGAHWGLHLSRGVMPGQGTGTTSLVFSPCGIGTSNPCVFCPPGGPYVLANLHDSGAPVLIEVPSTNPRNPEPELRIIGTVSSTTVARRAGTFNMLGGQPALAQAAFPTPEIADFNRDNAVILSDLFAFLPRFMEGAPIADVNGNGNVDASDVFAFLNSWFAAGS